MLKVTLFGPLQLHVNGTSLSEEIRGKHLALVAYLATTQRVQSRDILANLLWSDCENRLARKQLSNVVSDLKKHIGAYLRVTRQEIGLNLSAPHWIDVIVFRSLVLAKAANTDLSVRTQIIDLYQGEFLAGFSPRNASVFNEWVLRQQQEYHRMAVQQIARSVEEHLLQEDYTDGLALVDRWLQLEPETEAAHRQKMRLLLHSNQRVAALSQYELCRQMMDSKFGLLPSAEIEAIYEQIRSGKMYTGKKKTQHVAVASPVLPTLGPRQAGTSLKEVPHSASPEKPVALTTMQHNLPLELTKFFGRHQELASATETLLRNDCRLLTVTGMGGVGKSRFAKEVGKTMASLPESEALFADGIYWIAPPKVEPFASAQTKLQKVFTAIHAIATGEELTGEELSGKISSGEAQEPSILPSRVAERVRSRQMLLILDNWEDHADESGWLTELVTHAPDLKLLVTSRTRLHLDYEWLIRLDGLPTAGSTRRIQLDRCTCEARRQTAGLQRAEPSFYSPQPAEELFEECARRAANGALPANCDDPHITQICECVAGLPLGIELAASYLSYMDCSDVLELLKQNLDAISFPPHRKELSYHSSLPATLRRSWQMLTLGEQEALQKLVLSDKPIQVPNGLPLGVTLYHLFALSDQSLVLHSDDGLYTVHPLMRRFVLEQISPEALCNSALISA